MAADVAVRVLCETEALVIGSNGPISGQFEAYLSFPNHDCRGRAMQSATPCQKRCRTGVALADSRRLVQDLETNHQHSSLLADAFQPVRSDEITLGLARRPGTHSCPNVHWCLPEVGRSKSRQIVLSANEEVWQLYCT